MRNKVLAAALSTAAVLLASCGGGGTGGNGGGGPIGGGPIGGAPTPTPTMAPTPAPTTTPAPSPAPSSTGTPAPTPTPTPRPTPTPGQVGMTSQPKATFTEPWALAFEPGTGTLFVTEKRGTMKFYKPSSGTVGTVSGLPEVAYGGQGGLGDIAFSPDYATTKRIYLTWAETGSGDTRGAVLGRGALNCGSNSACNITGLTVIWRQSPKVTGSNHYSHRIAFSPDGQYIFLTSGERQKGAPAQDLDTNLGKFLRLNLDGTPADGNPFESRGGVSREIWSYGHRNILGIKFDASGRLWGLEHGPAGGDELNLIKRGLNYGWPLVSDGDDYDGTPIPDHSTRPDLEAPAISWNPVIAPGDFIFYSGTLFPWKGQVLIAGLKTQSIIRVSISGETAREERRYKFNNRIRDIEQGPDGALWLIEDAANGRLLRVIPS